MKVAAHLLLWLAIGLAGFGGGYRWHAGQTARSENRQLRDNLQQLSQTADALRQSAVQSALNYDSAIGRLDAVAHAREEDREQIRQWAADQRQALQQLGRARPELGQHAGAGVLQHWNRSNAGPDAADPAATKAAGQPGAAVPNTGRSPKRRMDRIDRKPRPGSGAVSRLPQPHGAVAQCGARMAGNRLALVLRSRAGRRADGGALPA